jgi:hypothetical protein
MTENILSLLFLAVSLLSVVTQGRAFVRAYHLAGPIRDRTVRTIGCRLIAAAVYVGLGTMTLIARDDFPVVSLAVFTAVQLLWQANSILDLRAPKAADVERVISRNETNVRRGTGPGRQHSG